MERRNETQSPDQSSWARDSNIEGAGSSQKHCYSQAPSQHQSSSYPIKWEARRVDNRLIFSVFGDDYELHLPEEPSPLKQVGIAESREDSSNDGGCNKDSLWQGGGSRQVPSGLSRAAGGGGGSEGYEMGGGADGDGDKDENEDRNDGEDENQLVVESETLDLTTLSVSRSSGLYDVCKQAERFKVDSRRGLRAGLDRAFVAATLEVSDLWSFWGYHKEAERLQIEALQVAENLCGEMSSKTITAMTMLISTYIQQRMYPEAEFLLLQVYEGKENRLKQTPNETMHFLVVLSVVWGILGRHEESEQLWQEIIELWRSYPVLPGWSSFQELRLLALSLYRHEKYHESELFYRRALELANLVHSQERAALTMELSLPLIILGKKEEARQLIAEAIRLGEDVLKALKAAAIALFEKERWEESLKMSLIILDTQMEELSPDNYPTVESLASLSTTCRKLEPKKEVEQLLEQFLKRSIRVTGINHPLTATLTARRASILDKLGDHGNAAELWREVLSLRKLLHGENADESVEAMNNLAYSWAKVGRYDDALKLQIQVVNRNKAVLGETHPSTIESLTKLHVYATAKFGVEPRVDDRQSATVRASGSLLR